MWALRGRILPMSDQPAVAPTESAVFTGRIWIADDGTIAAVTKGAKAGPPGSAGAPVIDVGTSLVVPGLVDLHNHLAYNTLPLWVEPTQQTPFLHHNSWTKADTYSSQTTWPAYALITACPHELLAYVEAKAIVGGTTSIQGSPPANKPRDGWLVRNIDDETFGTGNPNLVYASVLTMKAAALGDRANKMREASSHAAFIYHCSEGQRGSIVAREFTDAKQAGCLQPRFVAVHTNAVDPAWYADWSSSAGAIAWSPFSNLWLYGQTTDVPAAQAAGIAVCLGSDWAPSGTKSIQGELKSARVTADALGWTLTDEDLVRMVTCLPGDVLARAWDRQVGRLQPGAQADLLVIDAKKNASPFPTVVQSTEDDVELVVIDGIPRYGTPQLSASALTAAANVTSTAVGPSLPGMTSIRVGSRSMRLLLTQPSHPLQTWEWSEVVDRLDEVRQNPRREVEAAQAMYARWAGRLDDADAPLRLALDMPTGLAPIGGLPKNLDDLEVPPLQSLTHDSEWLGSVSGRGFHGGVLDRLAEYYG
jgi:5-methylthioadenosine/S-adenosylhomocysteine deaminase